MSVLSQGCSSMPVMKQYLLMTSVEMLAPSVRRTITRNTVPLAIEALDAQADAPVAAGDNGDFLHGSSSK